MWSKWNNLAWFQNLMFSKKVENVRNKGFWDVRPRQNFWGKCSVRPNRTVRLENGRIVRPNRMFVWTLVQNALKMVVLWQPKSYFGNSQFPHRTLIFSRSETHGSVEKCIFLRRMNSNFLMVFQTCRMMVPRSAEDNPGTILAIPSTSLVFRAIVYRPPNCLGI